MAPPNHGVSKALLQGRPAQIRASTASSASTPSAQIFPIAPHINAPASINDPARSTNSFASLTIPHTLDPRNGNLQHDQSMGDNYAIHYSSLTRSPEQSPSSSSGYYSNQAIPTSPQFNNSTYTAGPTPIVSSQQVYFPETSGSLGSMFSHHHHHHMGALEQSGMYPTHQSRPSNSSSGMSQQQQQQQYAQGMNYAYPGQASQMGGASGDQSHQHQQHFIRPPTAHGNLQSGPSSRSSSLGSRVDMPSINTQQQQQQYMYAGDQGVYPTGSSLSPSDPDSMECDPLGGATSAFLLNMGPDGMPLASPSSPIGGNMDDSLESGGDPFLQPTHYDHSSLATSPAPLSPSLHESQTSTTSSGGGGVGGQTRQLSLKPNPASSSKEKEQNKQKLYRNRKSEFTNRMKDELLAMSLLPSSRITHAPEILSKTADTLKDYREFLEFVRANIDGMPNNLSSIPGAMRKLISENRVLVATSNPPTVRPVRTPAPPPPATQSQYRGDIKIPVRTQVLPSSFHTTGNHSQPSFW